MKSLSDLQLHEIGRIAEIDKNLKLRRRLLDLGFVKNEGIEPILQSPFGGMRVYRIKKGKIALRDKDCKRIYLMGEGEKDAD